MGKNEKELFSTIIINNPEFRNSLEHKNCRSCVPMVASATRLRKKKQKNRFFVLFFAHLFVSLHRKMNEDVRKSLFRKLKNENCFWSYDVLKMESISDESLIEHVLLYLDIDDINKLFPLFGYKKVKRVWLDRVAPQGAMFRPYNILYAWYYFGAKRPEAYVKRIETRHMNRIMSA